MGGEGERRVVTILFCDVVGSTSLGERLDPEAWTEIMNGVFERLIPAVNRYGGTVTRLLGDAILALFGAPVAHEDDSYRALLAALDMLRDLSPYQEQIRRQLAESGVQLAPTDFKVRIGINTGLAVVGDVGSDQMQEYTAMGDAVNLAARMEQTAQPGTIQIAHDTYELLAPLVEVESLAPLEVKGKRDQVRAYRVLGLKSQQEQTRGFEDMESPLIGREREISLMRKAVARLLDGQGQIICLIGQAGLGKSRLVQELNFHIRDSQFEISWYEAESLSFETSQPYGLLQRLLRRIGGFARDDPPAVIGQRFAELLAELPPEQQLQFEGVLNALFGLERETGPPPLQGEELKRELFESTRTLMQVWATAKPMVLVFEDLHWADLATAELIRHLLPLVDLVPLVFLFVFRTYRHSAAWMVKQTAEIDFPHRYLEVELQPLSAQESNTLVGNLLNATYLPDEVGALILDRAAGVPFFVEEIVRDLVESGAVTRHDIGSEWHLVSKIEDLHIPNSLEAVLVARMDRLDESARRTLQLAAVIGRSFYYRVLTMMAGKIEQLEQQLHTLQQAGLIRESARIPELEFTFRHALTQEAAYNTILISRRRLYHQQTGEVMQQIFANQLDEHAPLIAHHFHQAGENNRALKYYTMAAESAARLYANDEATFHYSKSIETASRILVDTGSLVKLHRKRGLAYEMLGDFDKSRSDYEIALRMANIAEEPTIEWQVLLDLGKLWASRNYQQTGNYFERALVLARQMDDPVLMARSLNRVGNWHANAEHPRKAIAFHQEALAIFEQLEDLHGLANTLDLLGMTNILAGEIKRACQYYDRAIALFQQLDDRHGLVSSLTTRGAWGPLYEFQLTELIQSPQETRRPFIEKALKISQEIGWLAGESFALWALGIYHASQGQYGKAFKAALGGLDIATDIGHRQWMAGHEFNLGILYCDLLAGEKAHFHSEQALVLSREIQSQYWTNLSAATLAKAYLLLDDLPLSQAILDTVITSQTPMDSFSKRYCWARRAELALAQGEAALALNITDKLVDSTPGLSAGDVIPSVWRLRAEAHEAMDRIDEAESLLLAAIETAPRVGERSQLWRLRARLGRLYWQTKRPAKAEIELLAARKLIKELAVTIPDQSLRADFLQRANSQAMPP